MAIQIDQHGFPGCNVCDEFKAQNIQDHAFRSDHIFSTLIGLPLSVHDGPDAMGISETEETETRNHGNSGIAAPTAAMYPSHRSEQVLRINAQLSPHLKLMGEHIHEDFGIRTRIDMAEIFFEQAFFQGFRIGEIAIVGEDDAIGRIHIEGLGFFHRVGEPSGGIANMAHAHVALQLPHILGLEDVLHQPRVLLQVDPASRTGSDARRILPPMLKHQQGIIECLIHGRFCDAADDTTHRNHRPISKKPTLN